MQILDHQHDGPIDAGAGEQVQQRLEQARLRQRIHGFAPSAAGLQFGQQPTKLATAGTDEPLEPTRLRLPDQRSERAQQRRVGQLRAADVDATTGQDTRHARARDPLELGDQVRLPHARLPADEHRAGLPAVGSIERGGHSRELLTPTNERRTGYAPSHRRHSDRPKTHLAN